MKTTRIIASLASSGVTRLGCRCAAVLAAAAVAVSCSSVPPVVSPGRAAPPERIMGAGTTGRARMVAFFMASNPSADRAKVERMAGFYIDEGRIEGVNPDVAFVQMCLETGFLRFGGLVTEDMNNFCGLGSIGPGQPGNRFPDERTGVRAHVQHLKAYASPEPLAGIPTDPRYKYVNPKGKAPTVHGLSCTWAADPGYGKKLYALLERLYS
jgi:hypothetical protein